MTHSKWALALIVAALASLTSTEARADDLPVWLGRIAVNEAGWDNPGDYLAIWEVLAWRARGPLSERCGGDIRCALHAYSGRLHSEDRARGWVAQLDGKASEPELWPEEASWERHRESWERTLRLAERWLLGEVEAVCDRPPHHWGARAIAIDVERAERALSDGRWVDARCWADRERTRQTRNRFYTVRGAR